MKKKGKLLIYWDYELQTGADQAISTKGLWDGRKDYDETKKLLLFLKDKKIKCTFAVIGVCAEKGKLPYHSQNQIKQIAKMGHEVASHSYKHEYIPELNKKQLRETLRKSKELLENSCGKKVVSFVPPHNMPAEVYGLSIDIKKKKKLSKISLKVLYKTLASLGYKTYRNHKIMPITNLIFKSFKSFDPKLKHQILQLYLNSADGFGNSSISVVDHAVKTKGVAVICAHPRALAFPGDQSWENFRAFVKYIKSLEKKQKLEITTPNTFV